MAINISQLSIFNKIKIVLHTGEGKSGINHIKYWYPEFMKANVEFCVITRNIDVFKSLSKDFRMLTILFATTPLEIEEIVNKLPKLEKIFYTSNTGNNIHLLRFIDFKHIFIGTENSDRDSKVTKFMRAYDEAWVSSDAVIDKIKNEIEIRHLKCIKIGKPQLKPILEEKNEKSSNILYLVSNEGESENKNFSSIKFLPSILTELGNKNFDFVLNKDIGKRDKGFLNLKAEIKESSYIQNIKSTIYNEITNELLVRNKYIICDIQTFNNKILASGAIIFLFIPEDKVIENYTINKYISFNNSYKFSSVEELKNLILTIQDDGEDKVTSLKREKEIDYWIGTKETLNDEFILKLKGNN